MTDLDAIRARDAEWDHPELRPGIEGQAWRHRSEAGTHMASDRCAWDAVDDRRALLAEVDRLRAVRLEASESHVWLEGAATERARIRAAVEGLPEMVDTDGIECVGGVDRAAVLAAIEGETT